MRVYLRQSENNIPVTHLGGPLLLNIVEEERERLELREDENDTPSVKSYVTL